MAQHLRIGSVINYGGSIDVPTYENCPVTNITDAYIEFEWTDSSTTTMHVLVRPFGFNVHIEVVTD